MSGGALVNLSMKLHVEKDICFRCSQSRSVEKKINHKIMNISKLKLEKTSFSIGNISKNKV